VIDAFLMALARFTKHSINDFCDLESSDTEPVILSDLDGKKKEAVLVTNKGVLMSMIRIHGVSGIASKEDEEKRTHVVDDLINSLALSEAHTVDFYYSEDYENLEHLAETHVKPLRETLRRQSLELTSLIDEIKDSIANSSVYSDAFLILYTDASFINPNELKMHGQKVKDKLKGHPMPMQVDAQTIPLLSEMLRQKHHSAVNDILVTLKNINVKTDLLDSHEALGAIRKSIDSDVSEDFQVYLPGDKIPVRLLKKNYRIKHDVSELGYPRIPEQIISTSPERIQTKYLRVGDTLWANGVIEIPQQEVRSFNRLADNVRMNRLPWRIKIKLGSGGLNKLGLRKTITSMASFASNENKKFNEAVKNLDALATEDVNIVSYQVEFATSCFIRGDLNEAIEKLQSRFSQLMRKIETWGITQVGDSTGDDPAEMFFSSLPGFNQRSIAQVTASPVEDITPTLPLFHNASPWETGTMFFNLESGKTYPYLPGSSLQNSFNNIFVGGPGSGKSVAMNMLNFSILMMPGQTSLPYIFIMDIGASSKGFIDMVRGALPPNKKHLVNFIYLKNDIKYRINPMDTQLGSRFPTGFEMGFIESLFISLVTSPGKSEVNENLPAFIRACISKAYETLSDSDAKPYQLHQNPEVDKKLEYFGMDIDDETTWWEVTDFLFKKNDTHGATIAQRYAVPNINDVVRQANNLAIMDDFGDVEVNGSEKLNNYFARKMKDVVAEYPALSGATTLDIGEVRILTIDLSEVAKGNTPNDKKRIAIFYQLARFLARSFALHPNDARDFKCPDMYKSYHERNIKEVYSSIKHFVYDELHRAKTTDDLDNSPVHQMITQDEREGRKRKIIVTKGSQIAHDFSHDMIVLASSVFILQDPGGEETKDTMKRFGLPDTAKKILTTKVTGPSPKGSTVLAKFKTKNGIVVDFLRLRAGTRMRWALSTNKEDINLKDALQDNGLDYQTAIELVSKRFPGGDCVKYVEQMRRSDTYDLEPGQIVEDKIAEEILNDYRKLTDE
jgi:intracellular multiplication protein IcmB